MELTKSILRGWWLGSEIVNFSGFGAWVEDYDAPDHTWVHMDHQNGAHTMIEISFSYCHTANEPVNEFIYELIGTEGVIRYDRNQKSIIVHGKSESFELPHSDDLGFASMYKEVVSALDTGKTELLATGLDGLIATRISRESTEDAMRRRSEVVIAK